MARFPYLIVGAGMAAYAAAEAIRRLRPEEPIAMMGAERDLPYRRPPLSKGLWKGQALDKVFYDSAKLSLDLLLDRSARRLDVQRRVVIDDRGEEHEYETLLLATGGTPRRLAFGGDEIIYFRTVEDYRRLRSIADGGGSFVVIGGGFIGSEIGAALRMVGCDVTMVFPDDSIGARAYPPDLSLAINDYYREKGVVLAPRASVTDVVRRGDKLAVILTEGGREREVLADGVVAGIGIEPNVGLAKDAGIEVGNGIIVDEYLRTSQDGVFAAGDVAAFSNPALGGRVRVEHEDSARTMGGAAGRNMAGEARPYDYLPYFYSDLFELGYEAVGALDSRLSTVSDWKEPFREGVVYYLDGERLRGVLLWNVWGQVDAARELLRRGGPYAAADLIGGLPKAQG